jgi:hypothetical protein
MKGKPGLKIFTIIEVIGLLSLFLVACAGAGAEPPASQADLSAATPATLTATPESIAEPTIATTVPEALGLIALGNATYAGILDEPISLVDGQYQGDPFVEGGASRPAVILLPDPVAYGDLDGDGWPDAAVLLVSNSGGSGSFLYLAAIEARDGAPYNVATTLLGDRDQPQTLAITDGRVVVELLSHDDDDPACCPTVETVREFTLDGEILVEVD